MRQVYGWPGLITAAVALLVGMLAVQWLPFLPSRGATVALSAAALLLGWRVAALRGLSIVLLGFAWASWLGSQAMQGRLPADGEGQDFSASGSVVGLPWSRAGATGFLFDIEQLSRQGRVLPWRGLARVSWYGEPPSALAPCSRWHVLLRLRRPRGMINPGGADGERSALARGISAVGYAREDAGNQQVSQTPWCLDRWRASLADDIQARVADAHDAALLRAFTLGDTRALTAQDWDVARANGISHLIAISGFHVGVAAVFGVGLCWLVYWLWPALALRWPRPPAQALTALTWALAYAGLAGFGLPTVRTVLMIAAIALARCSRRAVGGAHSLALALIVILLVDPLAVLDPGFWLSFVGVAFLMLCLTGKGRGWRAFVHELTLGQLVMTIALLPLTLWFFGEASLVGALSNLVAVPFVSFAVVPCALLGLLLLIVCPPLATPALWLAAQLAHAQWWLLECMARWPGAHWYLPAVRPPALLLATCGAAWLFMPRGVPLRWLGAVLFLPLLWPARPLPQAGAFQAWVLDVGQGLSVIVRTRHHALVYDTGARYPSGFDLGAAAVIPSLHALGIGHLDVLMLSHADNDHAGGAAAVAAAFPSARRYAGEPERMHLPAEPCVAGQQWRWDGVSFRVLHPSQAQARASANDRSCVLLIEGAAGRLLLTGDIAADTEPRVAGALAAGPPLLLQVPHHGSRTSSSASFIAAARPAAAVVSAGWRNRFGHPRPEVLQRYAQADVPLFNTALEGAVQLDFPAAAPPVVAARWRRLERRYWREK